LSESKSYDESKLLLLVKEGDENAFARIFHHYRNKIYTVAYKLTHSTTVAEEIVEDVFLRIWKRRSFLDEIENFSAYLYTITRNEAYHILKQIAKNYKSVSLTDSIEHNVHNNADDYVIGKELSSLLQKAIDRLPHQQKQVYQLMKESDLKRNEVARLLNIQPDTVKFHLSQAMKNIRAYCLFHMNIFLGFIFFLS
jgi:RNA polymerase sigma-70 factor (ECF subfamily)